MKKVMVLSLLVGALSVSSLFAALDSVDSVPPRRYMTIEDPKLDGYPIHRSVPREFICKAFHAGAPIDHVTFVQIARKHPFWIRDSKHGQLSLVQGDLNYIASMHCSAPTRQQAAEYIQKEIEKIGEGESLDLDVFEDMIRLYPSIKDIPLIDDLCEYLADVDTDGSSRWSSKKTTKHF